MLNPSLLEPCVICPRLCRANRREGRYGFCGAGAEAIVSHFGPHFGEEPPISGTNGSGNVFFSPCNMRCIFCQNHQISHNIRGDVVSTGGLADIFMKLRDQGVHNINLVSPTPYIPHITDALRKARVMGLDLPVVYNTNAYETVEALASMEGLVDVYLPDFKYWHESAGKRLSKTEGYPASARAAIMEMKRQAGDLSIREGLAQKGLLIRLLVLPSSLAGTNPTLRWIKDHLGIQTHLSLMSQYYPMHQAHLYPMVARPVRKEEYDQVVDFAVEEGFGNVFVQDLDSSSLLIPDFEKDVPFEPSFPAFDL